ncbi:condensation domain-containing protein [Mycobacterium sp. NPDC050041]|uniref:condensation domain-containing protein n=1 Tax=Mycobacterium sp. NPDC050041 TaxID=3364293 RepID=UPI003C2FF6EA
MVAFGTIHDWSPAPGAVVTWHVTAASQEMARTAPVNSAPASYQQEQHLREFRAHNARGLDMARLLFGTWDLPGNCDVAAMTDAVNFHIRRHSAYHSWFEFTAADDVVRRSITDPEQIELAPAEYGEKTTDELRAHLLDTTPDPDRWGCFTFGIIQRADHFTVYMSVDHSVTDGMSAGVVFMEIQLRYAGLLQGMPVEFGAPADYTDYCTRERSHAMSLDIESPQIRGWRAFAANNGGTLPDFPLPLGDSTVPCRGGMTVVPLMDAEQAERFDAACEAAGVRFSGGVFACAALAERDLTGVATYCGLTPYDMRSTPAEFISAGWYATVMPVTVPVDGVPFAEAARSAQESFDRGKELASVPFARAVELANAESAGLRLPTRAVPLLSIIDARKIPMTDQWDALNVGIYGDSRLSDQVCMWVNRFATETTLTLSFPDNAVARNSVARYIDAIRAVYTRIAAGVEVPV